MCVHQLHSSSTEFTDSYYDGLYPGHIHTTPTQKALLAVGSGVAALQNPYRHGETHTHQHGAWVSSPVTVFADLCFLFHLPFFFSFKKMPSHSASDSQVVMTHTIQSAMSCFDSGWWHLLHVNLTPFHAFPACIFPSKEGKMPKAIFKKTQKKKKLSHEQKSTALQPSYRLSTVKSNMEIALLTVQWKAPHFLYFGNLRRICHTLQPSGK